MIFSNRYTQLFVSLIALLIGSPFILGVEMQFPLVSFIFLIVILLTLRALQIHKLTFVIIALLAFSGFFLELLYNFHVFNADERLISIVSLSAFSVFIGVSILIMLRNLFTQKIVSEDSVRGGIAVYLLIGCFWGILYQLVSVIDPGSFIRVTGNAGGDVRYLLFYFSFTTLTTVAFGDILPANEIARVLAALEGISGVLFIAVFVAQLVSLHVFHKTVTKQSVQPQPKGE